MASNNSVNNRMVDFNVSSSNGMFTNQLQPACYAVLTSTQSGVTGDAIEYPLVCNDVIINRGNYYDNTTGIFTTPVAGMYQVSVKVMFGSVGGNTEGYVFIKGPSTDLVHTFLCQTVLVSARISQVVSYTVYVGASVDISASVEVEGSVTPNIDIVGSTLVAYTAFGVCLLS